MHGEEDSAGDKETTSARERENEVKTGHSLREVVWIRRRTRGESPAAFLPLQK